MIPTIPELTTVIAPNVASRGPDPLSPEPEPVKLTTHQIDSLIADALGVSFIFAPIVNRLLPQRYPAKLPIPSTPVSRLASTLEQHGCLMPDNPLCEACDSWHQCEVPKETSE